MANYSTNEFKSGLKVLLEGDPCSIVENEFVKPGKGQAFNRVRLKNLKTGRVWEREPLSRGRALKALTSWNTRWNICIQTASIGIS